MEATVLEDEIIEVWRTLTLSQKQSVIQLIYSFKEDEVEMTEAEIEAYNKDIEEAEKRIANGEFTTIDQLEKEANEW